MKLAALLLLFPCMAFAHQKREEAPHVHGQARLQVAVEGGIVEVALQAPGNGILSFEHPPATSAETKQLADAVSLLRGARWLTLPREAGCRLVSRQADSEGYQEQQHEPAGHDQQHDHDHQDAAHRHAGFTAALRYECAQPARLDALNVSLATAFPNLHEVVAEVVTERGQNRVALQDRQQRVPLP